VFRFIIGEDTRYNRLHSFELSFGWKSFFLWFLFKFYWHILLLKINWYLRKFMCTRFLITRLCWFKSVLKCVTDKSIRNWRSSYLWCNWGCMTLVMSSSHNSKLLLGWWRRWFFLFLLSFLWIWVKLIHTWIEHVIFVLCVLWYLQVGFNIVNGVASCPSLSDDFLSLFLVLLFLFKFWNPHVFMEKLTLMRIWI